MRKKKRFCGFFDFKCFYCNEDLRKTRPDLQTRDHVIPKSRKPRSNFIVLACRKCNEQKGSKRIEDWRVEIKNSYDDAIEKLRLYRDICKADEHSRNRELCSIRRKIIRLIHKTSSLSAMIKSLTSIEIISKILELYVSAENNRILIIIEPRHLFASSEIKIRNALKVISESLKRLNGVNRVSHFTIQKIVDKGVRELDRADYYLFRKHYGLLLRVLINNNLSCKVISEQIQQIGEA